jgi:hypothetical protein
VRWWWIRRSADYELIEHRLVDSPCAQDRVCQFVLLIYQWRAVSDDLAECHGRGGELVERVTGTTRRALSELE